MTPVEHPYWVWGLFFGVVFVALFVDIVIVNRKPHAPTKKETVVWSIIWVSLALAFNAFIYWQVGNHTGDWTLAFTQAKLFLTGYLIELSLSVDNLFVFLLIFTFFKVPKKFQLRVLFWGIMGALVLRMVMIFAGAELVERFHWIIYIFGVFLVYTGISMFKTSDDNFEPHESAIVKFATKYIRISKHYDGDKFFVIQDGARVGTLLLLVLITVEFTDLVFAVDSIPAIFGITTDKFLVYTSNIFAILGLRTFYFLLAGLAERFHLLKYGLAVVLTFIGIKMLLPLFAQGLIMLYGADGGPEVLRNFVAGKYDSQVVDISLIVVIATIAASVVLSLIFPPRHGSKPADGE